ncbi:MAG: type II toxin-antitoxin system HicB family antitoxin [Desulfobacula sp.]|nr:type II toxin-antitoxin system HicB family antitoxin [Desulfobacula sp.]
MMNLMKINGVNAVITYDPEIEMFRGEFVELNGGADFYAKDIESLKKEGSISLKVFLNSCKERNIEPKKKYSGKFNVRVPSNLHANIASAAMAEGKSLNQWIVDTLEYAAHT